MTIHSHKATFISVTPQQRERLGRLIQDLIDLADLIDGDCDTEPSLASWDGRVMDDREADRADEEPWLGWTERIDQSDFSDQRQPVCMNDLEEQHDQEYDPAEYGDPSFIWGGGEDGKKSYSIHGHDE